MPKSFLVKQKKARWSELTESEAVKLATGEASEGECNRPEETKSPKRTLVDETAETKSQKGELEEENEDEKKGLMASNGTELHTHNDLKTAESVKGKKHDSCYKQESNGFGEFCWWTSISSRYELQNLPPPPKLISSVPRNGLTKVHHSAERQPVISLGQTHHFPLTANGFGVVSFGDHRTVPPAPDSIPLRASLDGFREMSLNFRHSSDGHCEAPTLCPSVVQATVPPPTAHLNGNHFFIHGHPFLTSHRQQDYIPTLQHKQNQNRKAGIEGEETKYKCEICNSSFTLQRLLNRHMKTHSFYKRYHCQFCTKGFNDTFDLKRHIRTHTGIKPFKCSRCDKSFTQRCSLEAHLTRVHGVLHKFGFRERRSKMFVCEDCGSTFTENSEFMKHLHEFHPETEKIIRARRNGGFAQKLKDVS